MEEQQQLNPLAVTHLLQHTLRSLCNVHDTSQWVYAVFWRILPRNYPPPKWDLHGGMYDRTRGNRRNWILVWEDGFCNFAASACGKQSAAAAAAIEPGPSGSSFGPVCEGEAQVVKGLQPELFFKMSHEIYNYGEGLIGKVAADHGHKWVFKEPQEQENNFLSSWSNPVNYHPRTWEAQFQSGIKTIALIAVREGVVQLGSLNMVAGDLSYVVLLRKKFAYLESIPGVLLPHPSSSSVPIHVPSHDHWPPCVAPPPVELYDQYSGQQEAMRITPSMSSLKALLSKLPSVGPAPTNGPTSPIGYYEMPMLMPSAIHQRPVATKEEVEEQQYGSRSMPYYVNVCKPDRQPEY